jgi:hypothetical protein
MAEPTAGKLKNTVTSEELPFSMNPAEYHLSRGFDYAVEPCLGQPAPLVAFRSGHAAELSFHLIFDRDADRNADPKKAIAFVRALGNVDAASQSVPAVEFQFGGFVFRGYPRQLSIAPYRFDAEGNPTGAKIDVSLLSNGDYEHGRA